MTMGYSQDRLDLAKLNRDNLNEVIKKKAASNEDINLNIKDRFDMTLLDWSIVLSDLEKIKELMGMGAKLSDRAMTLSFRADNNEIYEYLLKFEPPYPLANALINGDLSAVKRHFIKEGNLTVSNHDSKGLSSLRIAIKSGNPELVEYVLQHDPNEPTLDALGVSALHEAAESKNKKIIALLLANEKFKNKINDQDLFGRTPLQVAINSGNQEFITEYKKNYSISENQSSKNHINIGQMHLLENISKYIKLTGGDPKTMPDGGHCNGFAFLKSYYTSLNKQDEFFKILQLVSTWDGTSETLENTNSEVSKLSGNYKNLGQLFSQLANDLIWFQVSGLNEQDWYSNLKTELKIENQDSREQQYAFVSTNSDLKFTTQFKLKYVDLTSEQLTEYIDIATKSPNVSIDFGAYNHKTSLFAKHNSKIDYYDPNYQYELDSFNSAESFSEHFKSYLLENNKFSGDVLHLDTLHVMNHSKNPLEFEYFSKIELEKFQEEGSVRAFQEKSPNGFTPLHIAVLTNSLSNLESLLNCPDCGGLTLRDKDGLTPIDLALKMSKTELFEALKKSKFYDVNDHHVLAIYSETSAKQFEVEIKQELTNPLFSKSNGLLNFAVWRQEKKLVQELLEKGISPNEEGKFGRTERYPLFTAIKESEMGTKCLKLLLQYNADLSIKNDKNQTPLQYAESLGFEEVVTLIKNEMEKRLYTDISSEQQCTNKTVEFKTKYRIEKEKNNPEEINLENENTDQKNWGMNN